MYSAAALAHSPYCQVRQPRAAALALAPARQPLQPRGHEAARAPAGRRAGAGAEVRARARAHGYARLLSVAQPAEAYIKLMAALTMFDRANDRLNRTLMHVRERFDLPRLCGLHPFSSALLAPLRTAYASAKGACSKAHCAPHAGCVRCGQSNTSGKACGSVGGAAQANITHLVHSVVKQELPAAHASVRLPPPRALCASSSQPARPEPSSSAHSGHVRPTAHRRAPRLPSQCRVHPFSRALV